MAVAVGYEISSRINRAAHVREIIHPHGTFGIIGAAVAVGRLHGPDRTDAPASATAATSLIITCYKINRRPNGAYVIRRTGQIESARRGITGIYSE